MAEERTFSAWVRTGLTSVASGLGIVKLIPAAQSDPLVLALGMILTLCGGVAFFFGFWGYRHGAKHWHKAHSRAVPLAWIAVLTAMFFVATVLVMILIMMPTSTTLPLQPLG